MLEQTITNMSGWESYYNKNKGDEEEQEKVLEAEGEYKYSVRDSLIFFWLMILGPYLNLRVKLN